MRLRTLALVALTAGFATPALADSAPASCEIYPAGSDTLEKMERRIECDHQYIREWSIWMDLKILLRTLSVVFSTKNAY